MTRPATLRLLLGVVLSAGLTIALIFVPDRSASATPSLIASIQVIPNPPALALGVVNQKLYVAEASTRSITVFDTMQLEPDPANAVTASVVVGQSPSSVAVTRLSTNVARC